jgi:hypothetical protein
VGSGCSGGSSASRDRLYSEEGIGDAAEVLSGGVSGAVCIAIRGKFLSAALALPIAGCVSGIDALRFPLVRVAAVHIVFPVLLLIAFAALFLFFSFLTAVGHKFILSCGCILDPGAE